MLTRSFFLLLLLLSLTSAAAAQPPSKAAIQEEKTTQTVRQLQYLPDAAQLKSFLEKVRAKQGKAPLIAEVRPDGTTVVPFDIRFLQPATIKAGADGRLLTGLPAADAMQGGTAR